jgi:hypothetical protein
MELRDFLPAIIGSFVGVTGWLLVGLLIQRRHSSARDGTRRRLCTPSWTSTWRPLEWRASMASSPISKGPRSSAILPELATLLSRSELRSVVDAYMTHSGYRQLASRDDLPAEVRRAALGACVGAHERALVTRRSRAFTNPELRAMLPEPEAAPRAAARSESSASTKP